MELVPYQRSPRELSKPLSAIWEYNKKLAVCNLERPFVRTQLCCHLDLELLVFRSERNKFLFLISHPVYGIYFQIPEWMKTQVRRMLTSHLKWLSFPGTRVVRPCTPNTSLKFNNNNNNANLIYSFGTGLKHKLLGNWTSPLPDSKFTTKMLWISPPGSLP